MLVGYNATGNYWPGELGVSALNAPSEVYKLDPRAPAIGYDPRFPSDQVVIGRGRLVGMLGTASTSGGTIAQSAPGSDHETVLTLADGYNVAPAGFAPYNMYRAWAEHCPGNRPILERNHMIAVPYVSAINDAYGYLTQGDKITAFNSTNPSYKGCVVKWVKPTLITVCATATTAVLSGTDSRVPAAVVGSYTASSGAVKATAALTANASGSWSVSGIASGDVVLVQYGHGADMIAGEVYGIETNTDVPGFLKWVTANYGAWDLPPMFAPTTSALVTANPEGFLGANAVAIRTADSTATGALEDVKLDPSKPITISVSGLYLENADGTWTTYTGTLAKASFAGADNTQGAYYNINPFTGVIQFFGVASSSTGAALSSANLASITVSYYEDTLRGAPLYGQGIYGITDGLGISGIPAGTPPQFAVAGGIGILRVAIH